MYLYLDYLCPFRLDWKLLIYNDIQYSKSGTDDGAAAQGEAAFDPKTTSPEKEKDIAGKGGVSSVVRSRSSNTKAAYNFFALNPC